MDKEKKRKLHLVLYGIAIPVSLFALYTFMILSSNIALLPGMKLQRFIPAFYL